MFKSIIISPHPEGLPIRESYEVSPRQKDGTYISKGDAIIDIADFFSLFGGEMLRIYSDESGYVYYHQELFNSKKRYLVGTEVARIYSSLEELILEEQLTNKYQVVTDDFTKEKSLQWVSVNGGKGVVKNHYKKNFYSDFVINKGIPVLRMEEYTDNKTFNHCSKVLFLLGNKSVLDFSLSNNTLSKGKQFLLLRFSIRMLIEISQYGLSKMRIEYGDGRSPRTYSYEALDGLLIRNYASDFLNALNEIGFDMSAESAVTEIKHRTADDCYVYLMKDVANGYYKIGISNSPEYREHTLQSEKPTIELLKAKRFPSRRIAEAIEASLHHVYEEKRLRGEWFSLSPSEVNEVLETLSS